MVAQLGRSLILKLGDGATPTEAFTTIAGLRDTTITIDNQTVDVTSKDDAGVRKLLDGKILQSFSVSGTGVFLDDANMNTLRDAALANTHHNFQIVIPGTSAGGGTYEGGFVITSFEESGSYDGEAQYSISLESNGGVTTTTEAVAWTDTV